MLRLGRVAALSLAALGPAASGAVQKAGPAPLSVLLVESQSAGTPGYLAFASAFRATLRQRSKEPVAVYAEHLDLARFSDPEQAKIRLQFVRAKYRRRPIGAIVAVGDATLDYVQDWRDELWPGIPVVFVGSEAGTSPARQATTGITFDNDMMGTLHAALALLPDTERVALVGGRGEEGSTDALRRALDAIPGRKNVAVVDLTGLSMAETRRRVATLPARSIILYTNIFVDGAGQAFVPRDALALFAPEANAPIFSFSGTYLGHGIVGGSLLDYAIVGREAADRVLRVLAGERPESIPVTASAAHRLLFDGREMDRWGLRDSRLPPGSQVRLRPPTLWEEHGRVVLGAAGLVALQSLFITELLLSRRRWQESQRRLSLLSRRLITAQEEERSRIARDLHDDAGQRLALLAIELDELGAKRAAAAETAARAGALAGRARTLSSDLNRIAHDLRPASLDQLGLLPAARRFAEELAVRHDLTLEVEDENWPADVPLDVALVLYRVTQEALQNVVKHSGAPRAKVSFRGRRDGLAVVVSDPGRGFDALALPGDRGLGIAGMRERVGLVGGELEVGSLPSGGTTVEAWIPR